ncbi:MAG: N-formylglutamate amidohydrolase [Pseudomonadota bacterium]
MKDDKNISLDAFEVIGPERHAPWVLTCDHASNAVPEWVDGGDLGLPPEDMSRHIAYDLGAAGVTRALADLLGAPAILSRFSRLVIDPNRGEDDPTLIMQLYDGTIIPANRRLTARDRADRLDMLYRPYHDAYAALVAARQDPVIVAIHSFTPRLRGRGARPWHIGVLAAHDRRFSDPLITRLEAEPDLCVGNNEPYDGHLPGDAIDRQALRHGHHNTLIELRHDLIDTPDRQAAWAARLARVLTEVHARIL